MGAGHGSRITLELSRPALRARLEHDRMNVRNVRRRHSRQVSSFAGGSPVERGVGRLEPERVELMRQVTNAQREVRSWPEWMTARATMPKWMMEWDD